MNELELNLNHKEPKLGYQQQYAKWIWYLTRDKYKPILKLLEENGFHHPKLYAFKESLKQRGYQQEAINQYQLTELDLTRMGVSETDLRIRFMNQTDRIRLSLAKYFHELENNKGYLLYHVSLTYKPQKYELTPERVDSCFIKFHTQFVLPTSLGTKNIHHSHCKRIQPIVFAFLDEHDLKKSKFTTCESPIKLHHHAIYAVHPDAVEWFDAHIGENTFSILNQENTPFLTSDLKDCGAMRVLYASKMLETYPEFLSFPDKWKRCHEKYTNTAPSVHAPSPPKVKDAEELFRGFPRRTFPCQRLDGYVSQLESTA